MTADPTGPLPDSAPDRSEAEAAARRPDSSPRPRYGRRRGARVPVGDTFVSRLGPAADEPFAAIDDPDEPDLPRPTADTPISELRFVALDCETTGQTPHRLVELGAVAFTVDRHIMSFETLVHSNDRINPFARRIHGINPETLGGAPPPERVLDRFRRFAQGAVLVEHSADAFDTRLVSRTMRTPFEVDNLDTSRLAAAIWELKDTIGLERLCQRLDVHHRRPHHALADAEATAECFLGLLDLGRDQLGWRTLGDLLAVGQPPPPRTHEEHRRHAGARSRRRRRRGQGGEGASPESQPGSEIASN